MSAVQSSAPIAPATAVALDQTRRDMGLVDQGMSVLAAVLGSDPRPCLAFSAAGELILANPSAGAAQVAQWHAFSQSAGWPQCILQAQQEGSLALALPEGAAGELTHLALEGSGRPSFYLLRLVEQDAPSALTERSERLTAMAHDLRVPLHSMVAATEGLLARRSAGLGASTDADLAEVAALARIALERVRNLLEMARLDATSANGEPVEAFDLVALIREVTLLFAPINAQNGNRISFAPTMAEAWLMGPAHLIRTILQNLISNADRFSQDGEVQLRLAISPPQRGQNRTITLEIDDNGPGMPEAARANLLAPGRSARGPSSQGGYGLGLGIVARAVSRLQGHLEVAASQRGGTLFQIGFALPEAGRTDAAAASREEIRFDGVSMVVVEDNPVNLAILLRMLTDAGALAEGLVSGEDALLKLTATTQGQGPKLVVMDVSLPDIDGIEVTRRLRAARGAAAGPLIVGLTAHDGPVIHGACLAAGMNRVLVKPIGPAALRQALNEVLCGDAQAARMTSKMPIEAALDQALVAELFDELGPAASLAFMAQALSEAHAVRAAHATGCATATLRAMIHSAIGSAGLTGLARLSAALRLLQDDVRSQIADQQAGQELDQMLALTAEALQELKSRPIPPN